MSIQIRIEEFPASSEIFLFIACSTCVCMQINMNGINPTVQPVPAPFSVRALHISSTRLGTSSQNEILLRRGNAINAIIFTFLNVQSYSYP